MLDACSGELPSPETVTAADDDGTDIQVQFTESVEIPAEGCASDFDYTRTWSATDACDNTAEATQIIRFRDLHAPVYPLGGAKLCIWPPNHKYVEYVGLLSGN